MESFKVSQEVITAASFVITRQRKKNKSSLLNNAIFFPLMPHANRQGQQSIYEKDHINNESTLKMLSNWIFYV